VTTNGLSRLTGSAYLETGVRLHYFDVGHGDDALVLLHGYPQTSWQWRHILEPLAEAGYRVIAPDYRGAGRSSRPRNDPGRTADLRRRHAAPLRLHQVGAG
jgi:pimeloyl-ACP methyl ester carboxylesterase